MTTLTVLLVLAVLPAIGSLVFMYQARNGEWVLNQNSWHLKFLDWLRDNDDYASFRFTFSNACPYYWFLVLNVYLFPLIFLIRTVELNKNKINFPKLPLPKVNISTEKKEVVKTLVNNSVGILKLLGILALCIVVISFVVVSIKFDFYLSVLGSIGVMTTAVFLTIGVMYTREYLEENYPVLYRKNKKFWSTIWDCFWYLPIKLFEGVKWVFSKLFNFATDLCPPIKWKY